MMVLLAYDWCSSSWNKLPLTCSHLPGKTPGWILAMQCFGVITLVPVLQTLILATLYSPPTSALVLVLCAVVAAWTRVHAVRREGWTELRIKFDETPEPAVNGLNLLR